MKSLILISVLLHALFLLSVFYIYFRSIIVPGLLPLSELENPPAKRLVLIVSDGLRAESFFDVDCDRTPFLRNVLLRKGMIGISHTHVPTESRPGHVALIAGVYEDPSSIFKGWKENAVEFDSVFNRSSKTFAWGSPDILPMFSKGATPGRVIIDTYHSDEEVFSESAQTFLLDKWVFDRVKSFLSNSESIARIKDENRVVFFLHLLGMDTSGHTHKPHSQRYTDNLKLVDQGIGETVKLFEETFNDNSTAFIFTSDHGMTNRGSHGAGHQHETETPFLVWGAGINYWLPASEDFVSKNHVIVGGKKIPRYDIQQADAAPLMSTLLGIPVPTNSFGKLPYMYPNVTKVYLANAFSNNAYQLHAMYSKLHQQAQLRTFQFSFNVREKKIEEEISFLDEQIRLSFTIKDYDDIIVQSNKMITAIYDGIDFYQMYYKNELLVSLTMAMLGWILLLCRYIVTSAFSLRVTLKALVIGCTATTVIVAYNILQGAPAIVIVYFILPIALWTVLLGSKEMPTLRKFLPNKKQTLIGFACLVVSELLVFSFFQRKVLSLILLGYVGAITTYAIRKKLTPKQKILKYFSSAVILGIFPLFRVVEKDTKNSILLTLGTVFWIFHSMDFIYLKRSDRFSVLQTVVLFVGGLFILYLVISLETGNDLENYQQVIAWLLLASPLLIFWRSYNMEIRLKSIGNAFSLPFVLMSLSYEPLFLIFFFAHIISWVEIELIVYRRMKKMKDFHFENIRDNRRREVDFNDVRCVMVFMLYLMISFFGTGNMATISSFDPNWVRCLVKTFSPFLMATLIIFKLAIPIILLTCGYRAIHVALRVDAKKIFVMVLVVCDVMCLNFLFLVKNKGSWLDIGTSLSHFVIMEVTTLVLILFYAVAQFLTSFQICKSNDRKFD